MRTSRWMQSGKRTDMRFPPVLLAVLLGRITNDRKSMRPKTTGSGWIREKTSPMPVGGTFSRMRSSVGWSELRSRKTRILRLPRHASKKRGHARASLAVIFILRLVSVPPDNVATLWNRSSRASVSRTTSRSPQILHGRSICSGESAAQPKPRELICWPASTRGGLFMLRLSLMSPTLISWCEISMPGWK